MMVQMIMPWLARLGLTPKIYRYKIALLITRDEVCEQLCDENFFDPFEQQRSFCQRLFGIF